MKIIALIAENFKRLKAIDIKPGDKITLTGDNGAGKSSVLDAIAAALGAELPAKPIRDGEKNAEVKVTLSNGLVVTRRFTPSGSTLKIEEGDNIKKSPQAILDKLIGSLSFDPLAFVQLKAPQQAEALRKLVGLDFTTLEKQRATVYEARTITNRDLASAQTRLAVKPAPTTGVPTEPVSVANLMTELSQVDAHNEQRAGIANKLTQTGKEIASAKEAIKDAFAGIEKYQAMLKHAQEVLAKVEEDARVFAAQLEGTPAKDRKPITDQIANAETVNSAIRLNKERADLEAEIAKLVGTLTGQNEMIEACDAEKAKQLREAKYPLPGLAFTETGVTYNGIPFEEISDGERLRVSVAIGMAMNPTLKVIFARNASMLDSKGLAIITELAKEQGYQLWVEDNRSHDPTAVIIEEGEVHSLI